MRSPSRWGRTSRTARSNRSLTINPVEPANIVGSWQQDRWSNGGSRGLVAGVSYDGGSSWAITPISGVTVCTGGRFLRASDPWLSFGPTGELYHASLVFHTDTTPSGLAHRAVLVSKSTDGGTTWSTPTAVVDSTDAQVFDDKEAITADPTDAALVYVVWDRIRTGAAADFVIREPQSVLTDNLALPRAAALSAELAAPAYFARSLDGGQTWEAARSIYDPGPGVQTVGNQIVVQLDGTLLDAFTAIQPLNSGSTIDTASLLRSTDHGGTWVPWGEGVPMRPRVLFSGSGIGVYDPSSGHALRTGDGLAEVTVNPANGDLYLVWEDARFSHDGQFSDPTQLIDEIAFSTSTDGGVTWSVPIKVNQTPADLPLGNRQAFTPNVRVAGDGTIVVTYYDFRFNDTSTELKTDYLPPPVLRAPPCHAPTRRTGRARSDSPQPRSTCALRQTTEGFSSGTTKASTDGAGFLGFFSQTVPAGFASTFVRRVPIAKSRQRCVGDCNDDGLVTVDELELGIDIALGTLPVSACPSFDVSGIGTVTVAALIRAADNALNGCGG